MSKIILTCLKNFSKKYIINAYIFFDVVSYLDDMYIVSTDYTTFVANDIVVIGIWPLILGSIVDNFQEVKFKYHLKIANI